MFQNEIFLVHTLQHCNAELQHMIPKSNRMQKKIKIFGMNIMICERKKQPANSK